MAESDRTLRLQTLSSGKLDKDLTELDWARIESHARKCLPICRAMFEESKYHKRPYNPGQVLDYIKSFMHGPSNICNVVIENATDSLVGFISAHATDYFFNDQTVIHEDGFYVAEDYRNSGAGSMLIASLEDVADLNSADLIVSVSAGIEDDKVCKMLLSRGYTNESQKLVRVRES